MMDNFILEEQKLKREYQLKYDLLEKEYFELLENDFSKLKEIKETDNFLHKTSKYISIILLFTLFYFAFLDHINNIPSFLFYSTITATSYLVVNPIVQQISKTINHFFNSFASSKKDYDQITDRLKQLNNEMNELEDIIKNIDNVLDSYKFIQNIQIPSFNEEKDEQHVKKRIRRK